MQLELPLFEPVVSGYLSSSLSDGTGSFAPPMLPSDTSALAQDPPKHGHHLP